MYMESFWKKHANDSDWDSRYIDIDRSSALSDFTQTTVGSGSSTYGTTGLVIVNSAASGDGTQFQYNISSIQPKAPKTPSTDGLHPGIWPYEMEFVMSGIVGSPASLLGFIGFCSQDTTILGGHADSIGLTSPAASAAVGLDLYTGSVNQITNYPSGGLNPAAFGYLPADGLSHEIAFQAIPLAGNGLTGEMKIWLDGNMVADFGIGDQALWVGLTQAALAPSFAFNNASASLTTAQRTVTVQRLGWAIRR